MMREARGHARAGRLQRARALYELLLARSPRDDEARASLARVLSWSGAWRAAERHYREVLRRHPDDVDVRSGLVDVLLWQRRWKEAQVLLDEGLERRSGSAELLEREARLAYWKGERARARALADLAAARGPESVSLAELRSNLHRGELRVTGRHELLAEGLPDLPSGDLQLMLRDDRTTFRARTWQGLLLSTREQQGRDYNASYGIGASRRVDEKTTISTDVAVGLPASATPQLTLAAAVERPLREELVARFLYAFRLYPEARHVHTWHPAVSVAATETVHVTLRYWLTNFRFPPALSETPHARSRFAHAYGIGAVFRPRWPSQYGVDYAHGAQVEVVGEDFRLIGLRSDTASVWTEQRFDLAWGIRPRYGVERRSTETGFTLWVHTAELGVFRRW